QRGMLGVGIQPVTSDLAASLGLKEARGVVVNSLTPEGPAEKAGIKPGDVIVKFNGKEVNDANELRNAVAANEPGTEVSLTLLRSGNQQDVKVRLATLTPEAAQAQQPDGAEGGSGKLGLSVRPITPEIAGQLGLRRGI